MLVTGGSSGAYFLHFRRRGCTCVSYSDVGIGLAAATALSKLGATIVIGARDKKRCVDSVHYV